MSQKEPGFISLKNIHLKSKVSGNSLSSSMKLSRITVKTLTAQQCSLDIDFAETTVKDLKQKVAEQLKCLPSSQRLIYGANELLDDELTLQQYHIKEETAIHLLMRQQPVAQSTISVQLPENSDEEEEGDWIEHSEQSNKQKYSANTKQSIQLKKSNNNSSILANNTSKSLQSILNQSKKSQSSPSQSQRYDIQISLPKFQQNPAASSLTYPKIDSYRSSDLVKGKKRQISEIKTKSRLQFKEGLVLEGRCVCLEGKDQLYFNKGFGDKLNLGQLIYGCYCPYCRAQIQECFNFGFFDAKFQIHAQKNGQSKFKLYQNVVNDGKYHRIFSDEENFQNCEYNYIFVKVSPFNK